MTQIGSDYSVELSEEREDDGTIVVIARHPELPGCMSHGASIEEALENLRDARALYIEGLRERGLEVPRPSHAVGP